MNHEAFQIIDLQGNEYEINSVHVYGDNIIRVIIKKPNEDGISRRKGRELIQQVNGDY